MTGFSYRGLAFFGLWLARDLASRKKVVFVLDSRRAACPFNCLSTAQDFLATTMLVLYETAMGYCLFKVTDTAKLESADLWKEFETPEQANRLYVTLSSS